MDLKNISDQELAKVMVSYITRVKKLLADCLEFIKDNTDIVLARQIKDEYTAIKSELSAYGKYVGLRANQQGSLLYTSFFIPSIAEADAYGFCRPVNAKIDNRFFGAIEEAHYKLTKYKTLEEWRELARYN